MNWKYVAFLAGLIMTALLLAACSGNATPTKVAPRNVVAQTSVPAAPDLSTITGVAAKIPHSTKLRFECLLCHGQKGDTELPYPDNHIGVTQDKCQICHVSAVEQAKAATAQ